MALVKMCSKGILISAVDKEKRTKLSDVNNYVLCVTNVQHRLHNMGRRGLGPVEKPPFFPLSVEHFKNLSA